MNAQLRELLTGYGDIAGIWFDGMWDKPDANWHLDKTYGLIDSLQPAALVGSNHHLKPFPGEDFQMFEKDLPGERSSEFNAKSEIGALPLETCDTINNTWGYNSSDKKFKSTKQLIQYLVRAAGNNANFLLNVGPMPNGRIQPHHRPGSGSPAGDPSKAVRDYAAC
ncbi:MAG: alpha-L-fucosidase [Bryobacteraceae bacterium]